MKTRTKVYAAFFLCLLLLCTAALSVSAVGRGGVMPRTGTEFGDGGLIGDVTGAIGDITDAIGDAAGALTDEGGMMQDGTNIPEDSGGIITEPDTTRAPETTRPKETTRETVSGTATDSMENAPGEKDGNGAFVGVIVAIIIAIAVILLIIALMPKKRMD